MGTITNIEIVKFEGKRILEEPYFCIRKHKVTKSWFFGNSESYEFLSKYSKNWFGLDSDGEVHDYCQFKTYEKAKNTLIQYNDPQYHYGTPVTDPE
jgi:hypothetical protein